MEPMAPVTDSFTHHGIVPVFRALSQRKRQGLLSITAPEGEYVLSFYDGRIVAVSRSDESMVQAIIQRLYRARLLPSEVVQAVGNVNLSMAQGYAFLVGKGHISPEDFARAKAGYELDLVHSLRFLSQPQIHFTPKVIARDPQLVSAIYPGQVLLDVIELESDEARYDELFAGQGGAALIVKTETDPRGLIRSEQVVWDSLDDLTTPEEIFERTLLSVYEIKEALLSLFDQGLISFMGSHSGADELGTDIAAAEAVSNSAYEITDGGFVLAPEGTEQSDAGPVELRRREGVSYFADKIEVPMLSGQQKPEGVPTDQNALGDAQILGYSSQALTMQRIDVASQRNGEATLNSFGSVSSTVESDSRNTTTEYDAHNWSTPERPEDQTVETAPRLKLTPAQCAAFCVFAYLLALAILGPLMLNSWFDALRSYLMIE